MEIPEIGQKKIRDIKVLNHFLCSVDQLCQSTQLVVAVVGAVVQIGI